MLLLIEEVLDIEKNVTSNSSEVLNLTVCSNNICECIHDRHVSGEAPLSDHNF